MTKTRFRKTTSYTRRYLSIQRKAGMDARALKVLEHIGDAKSEADLNQCDDEIEDLMQDMLQEGARNRPGFGFVEHIKCILMGFPGWGK